MFIVINFIKAIAQIIELVLNFYLFVVIVRALISWVNPDPYNPIVRFLHSITDPIFFRISRFLPRMGPIDITPMIVILIIIFLKTFVVNSLYQLADRI